MPRTSNTSHLRGIIHGEAHVLADYLADNYCPTIEEEHQEGCPGHLAQHYPDMLGAVVHRLVTIIETAMIGVTTGCDEVSCDKQCFIAALFHS